MSGISPLDCKHRRSAFIGSHRSSAGPVREHISVCRDCGQFRVSRTEGEHSMVVTFELATGEAVEAAGQYLKYLEVGAIEPTREGG